MLSLVLSIAAFASLGGEDRAAATHSLAAALTASKSQTIRGVFPSSTPLGADIPSANLHSSLRYEHKLADYSRQCKIQVEEEKKKGNLEEEEEEKKSPRNARRVLEETNGSATVVAAELTQVLEEKGSYRKQREMSTFVYTFTAWARMPEKKCWRKSLFGMLAANMCGRWPHNIGNARHNNQKKIIPALLDLYHILWYNKDRKGAIKMAIK